MPVKRRRRCVLYGTEARDRADTRPRTAQYHPLYRNLGAITNIRRIFFVVPYADPLYLFHLMWQVV